MKVINIETGKEVTDEKFLMREAGLDYVYGFEDIGIQGDGTPIVFDKCGNYGYLSYAKYKIVMEDKNEHNALDDAKWNKAFYDSMMAELNK